MSYVALKRSTDLLTAKISLKLHYILVLLPELFTIFGYNSPLIMVLLRTNFCSQHISASFWCNIGQNFLVYLMFWIKGGITTKVLKFILKLHADNEKHLTKIKSHVLLLRNDYSIFFLYIVFFVLIFGFWGIHTLWNLFNTILLFLENVCWSAVYV